jgi:hypothetical protein
LDIATAQSELREAYANGGPGAIVSRLVWLAAGMTTTFTNISIGFAVLFFGGMLIFPVATYIVRTFLRRAPAAKGNPGGLTVVETIFSMIGGLLAAWLFIPHRPDFVFPLAAIAVGAHYFGFRTAYGDNTYWILAGIMCSIGIGAIFTKTPADNTVPYLIAAIELVFGIWLTRVGLSPEPPHT